MNGRACADNAGERINWKEKLIGSTLVDGVLPLLELSHPENSFRVIVDILTRRTLEESRKNSLRRLHRDHDV